MTDNTSNAHPTGATPQSAEQNPIVVGLDIGTTKIACIVGQRDKYGKVKILGMGRADSNGGVKRGEVYNIQITTEAIKLAVAEAERQSGVEIKVVYVGIAGQHISSKQNRGIYTLPTQDAEITAEDVKNMVDDMYRLALEPGERIIHVLPQEFSVDSYHDIKQPIGYTGSRLEANFHIITGKVAAAQNIKRCVERAGLQMLGLILEPLASSASVLKAEEMEAGVALVDIGGGTTDIAIFQDGIIRHTAVIPFAGEIIAEDIKNGCMVLKDQAEKLKVRFGSAVASETQENEVITIPGIAGRDRKEISMHTLSRIIQARMEEIFTAVHFEIKSSGYANKLIAGIVVTGGGSQMKHLKQLVEYTTGYDTRIGIPAEHITRDTKDEIKNPMYATGLGLIIMGYDELAQKHAELVNSKKLAAPAVTVVQQPAYNVNAATVTTATVTPVAEVVMEAEERESTVQKPLIQKNNWIQKFSLEVKNWFADADVNKDFE